MTAGRGVAHAEESTERSRGALHGVQLWVAQPDDTRRGEPAFEHHASLPQVDVGCGVATVLVGTVAGEASPARRDTDHVGADLALRKGTATLPLLADQEHALVVLDGAIDVDGRTVGPGHLAYLGTGRDELVIGTAAPARALLLGGTPFPEPPLMWWNFVARSRDEISEAYGSWAVGDDRFGRVRSDLPRVPVDPPVWLRGPDDAP
jgi:redox-sensitive bicupin YhaK (pirin superfamily)